MSKKEEKLKKHVRLAKKHIREIEKLGYVVEVTHNTLDVLDYDKAPAENKRDSGFSPMDYVIETIQ